MQYKYIYKNKRTGKKIYTNVIIVGEEWEIVREIRDGKIKSNEVLKK